MSKNEFLSKLTREHKVGLLFDNKIFKDGVIDNYPLENNNHVDYYLSDEQLDLLKGLETDFDLTKISEFAKESSLKSVNNIVYIPFGNFGDKKGFESLFVDFDLTIKFINTYIKYLRETKVLVAGVFYLTNEEVSEKFSEMVYLLKNKLFDFILINEDINFNAKLLLKHDLDSLVFLNDGSKISFFNLLKEEFKDEESLISHLSQRDSSSRIDDKFLDQILIDLENLRMKIELLESGENIVYNLKEVAEELVEETIEEIKEDLIEEEIVEDLIDEVEEEIDVITEIVSVANLNPLDKDYPKKKVKTVQNRKSTRVLIKIVLNILAIILALGFYVGLGFFMEYSEGSQAIMIFITVLLLYLLLRVVNNLYKVNVGTNKVVGKNELLLNELETIKPASIYNYNEEVVDEPLEEVEQVVIKESIVTFESLIDLNNYVTLLNDYLKVNGITASSRLVRNMFANLVANRINVLSSNNEELLIKTYELFAKFIGANINVLDVNNNMTDIDYLENERSPLNQAIKIANQSKEKINILVLKDLNYDKFASNYRNIIEHAKSPNTKHSFKIRGKEFRIPRNLWFIVVPNEQVNPSLYGDLGDTAVFYNMYLEAGERNEEVSLNKEHLSFYMLNDIMRDEREFHYLEEDVWKKLDKLDEYLTKLGIKIFNNYIVQAIENFTTMYFITDGDRDEVLDDLLSVKIFPQVTGLDVSKVDESDLSFVDFCEDLFGVENLNNSQAILSKIQELSNQK